MPGSTSWSPTGSGGEGTGREPRDAPARRRAGRSVDARRDLERQRSGAADPRRTAVRVGRRRQSRRGSASREAPRSAVRRRRRSLVAADRGPCVPSPSAAAARWRALPASGLVDPYGCVLAFASGPPGPFVGRVFFRPIGPARSHPATRPAAASRRLAPYAVPAHGRPGAHPQLLDHRPHRPWEVDAGRSHPRADEDGRDARHEGAAARLDGPRARARDHDQGAGGARAVRRLRRRDLPAAPDRHARPRRLHLRGLAARSPRARARCSSSTPRRASRRRRSRTPTSRSTPGWS